MTMNKLLIVTTGGTIDKIYFDDMSDYQIGDPQIGSILNNLQVGFEFEVNPLMRKDSLHITDDDRQSIHDCIACSDATLFDFSCQDRSPSTLLIAIKTSSEN